MQIKKSILQQELFVILDSMVKVMVPREDQVEDIDDIWVAPHVYTHPSEQHCIRVIVEIKVESQTANQPGYSIAVQGSSDFRIDDQVEINSELYNELKKYTAVENTYNNIRIYLQNITSYFPLPPYLLPAVDVKDLWEKLGDTDMSNED